MLVSSADPHRGDVSYMPLASVSPMAGGAAVRVADGSALTSTSTVMPRLSAGNPV